MKRTWQMIGAVLLCVGLASWAASASQGAASAPAEVGPGLAAAGQMLGAELVIPGFLTEGQQLRAQREVRLTSPVVVAEREASRTRFAGLDKMQAVKLDGEAFPAVIDRPEGGLGGLEGVRQITGFPSEHAAAVVFANGKHGVVESREPIAVAGSSGRRVPINLGLKEVGGAFEPVRSLAAVRIPKRVGAGVQLGRTGVSLTPIDQSGAPAGGSEGMVDGTSVLYTNTQANTDTVIKPTTSGFEADTLLRSVVSPGQIAYRVSMPKAARLTQDVASGVVQIIDQGRPLATVLPPSATDADGTPVPVSMTVAGDILTLRVAKTGGRYAYPILVDPHTIDDESLGFKESGKTTNWVFKTSSASIWGEEVGLSSVEVAGKANYNANEYALINYSTQGESRIYFMEVTGWAGSGPFEVAIHIVNSERKVENGAEELFNGEGGEKLTVLGGCATKKCGDEAGTPENSAQFGIWTTGAGNCCVHEGLDEASVGIAQSNGPEITANKSSETVGGKHNALYGAGSWLGPNSNSDFEVQAHDPGIGISKFAVESSEHSWVEKHAFLEEKACGGVQCKPTYDPVYGYNSKLPNGEDPLVGSVEDAIGLKSELGGSVTLKVDSTKPHGITISGLGAGNEIGEGEYELKAEATDGTGTTKIAGIKSLAIAVDGREVGKPNGSCTESLQCTAKGEWAINGGEFGAGQHRLTVTATDNAGNIETATYTLKVHAATPVSLGPGTVNPQSGEFSMSATDVSIPTPGSNLTVARSYRSRHLTAGGEGPLGPQWSLTVGGQESITQLPDGNATLTAANGGLTTFTSAGSGKFSAPTGDSNLTLTEGKNTSGELVEYVLADAADGVTTRFTSTSGPTASLWKATKQEGPLASQTVKYGYETVEGVTEPKYAIAPEPAGVEGCLTKLEKREELPKGCRALTFEYAHETSAKGEKPNEWKAYKGRLKEVLYTAYNAATEKAVPIPVAEYAYDAKGRLRAEWNPQVAPTLVMSYGYDAESHITAVNPPGQQPWLLHYGTVATDASTGRVLSVTWPAAVTVAERKAENEQAPPAYSKGLTLSSTKPAVGTKISVSGEGTWNNGPMAYSYDWEDCNSSGGECKPIAGAVNQSYYPVKSDEGHALVAQVSAVNADGTVVAASASTSAVTSGTESSPAPEPPVVGTSSVWTVEYQVPLSGASELPTMTKAEEERWGQTDDPVEATAIFPPDSPQGWPAKTYKRASVQYLDSDGRAVNANTPSGGIATAEFNAYNDVVRTLTPDNRATALKEPCEKEKCKSAEVAKLLSTESTYEEKGSEPGTELLSTLGPEHTVQLPGGSQVQARAHTVYSYNEGAPAEGGPYHLVTKSTTGAVVAGKEEAETTRTTKTSYTGTGTQENLGWKLRKPTSVTIDPGGLNLVHTTEYDPVTGNVTETKMPAATGKDTKVPPTYASKFGAKGTGAGQLDGPAGDAIGAHGNVWAVNYAANDIEEFSATGTFIETMGWGVSNGEAKLETCTSSCKAGLAGSGAGQFSGPWGVAISGEKIYVADYATDNVEVVNEKAEAVMSFGSKGTGAGQMQGPAFLAISAGGDVWVGDKADARLDEFNASTGAFVETIGFGVSNGEEKFEICTSACKTGLGATGNGGFTNVQGIAITEGHIYAADSTENHIEEYKENGEYVTQFGGKGSGNGQFSGPTGLAAGAGALYVSDAGNDRIEKLTTEFSYLSQVGAKGSGAGQLSDPEGVAVNTSSEIYVDDYENSRIEKWVPTITGNEGAHDSKTIYYSTAPNEEHANCGKHAEWANLPCQTLPATQPGTGYELPVTVFTYNVWDEPLTTTETVGTTTIRTKTDTYDAAGRLKTAATTASVGTALPTVTYGYTSEAGAETGAVTTLTTGAPGKTESITSVFNTLGQLASYTDAAENASTYEYDVDGRIKKINNGKGTETYAYNETTGYPTEVLSEYGTSKLTFTGTYDAEGNMHSESYPNGMTATYAYNAVGKPTSVEYEKTTHCTEKCVWFSDKITPSIEGQWLTQTSTLSKQAYAYDNAGRLIQVQNTPTGKDCTTRIYGYDEDTNRTSLTTRESSTEKCATESGTTESHTYDTADRLTDSGTTYNEFGDITSLPATDAGGKEASEGLTSTYYTDNQLATQTQNEETIGYNLDPARRTLETVATGKKASDFISHYAGPGSAPAWTVNPSMSSEWTRHITGLNGELAATQTNNETPVLQITNLHGDVIATAALSETATELASKADTSEFGVPTTSLPPKYAWLGADEIPTELPSGTLNLGARSYVPQVGRFLQPDPTPGGSANSYAYTFGNPVNEFDPSGDYSFVAGYVNQFDEEWAAGASAREAARIAARIAAEEAQRHAAEEAAARYAAELAAQEAAWAAEWAAGPQYAVEWEEWEEWEEGEWEWVSYHQGAGKKGHAEAHLETGVLYESLGEATSSDEAALGDKSAVPLCLVGARTEGQGEKVPAQSQPCARGAFFIHLGHIIHDAEHLYNTVGRYIVRGFSEAVRATGSGFSAIRQGFEIGVRGYFEDGGPP